MVDAEAAQGAGNAARAPGALVASLPARQASCGGGGHALPPVVLGHALPPVVLGLARAGSADPRRPHRAPPRRPAAAAVLCALTPALVRMQEGILKDALEKAKERKERAEAGATLDERVALNAQAKEEARQLRKAEGESFQAEIMRQVGGG